MAVTSFSESQALTRSAPSAATEGQEIKSFASVRVVIEAPEGETLAGSGSLDCWFYDSDVGGWARLPGLDLTIDTADVERLALPEIEILGPRKSRLLWAANGVTVSDGEAVTVHQLGYVPKLEGQYI